MSHQAVRAIGAELDRAEQEGGYDFSSCSVDDLVVWLLDEATEDFSDLPSDVLNDGVEEWMKKK